LEVLLEQQGGMGEECLADEEENEDVIKTGR
jgi:hypothetical protein